MGTFPLPSFSRNFVFSNIGAGIDCAGQVVTFSCNNINGNSPDFDSGDPCEEMMASNGNFSEYPIFGVASCLPGPTNWCLLEGSPQLPLNSPPECGLVGVRGECPPIGVPVAQEASPRRFHARAARCIGGVRGADPGRGLTRNLLLVRG